MTFSVSKYKKSGPISVVEEDGQFLVRLSFRDKERAKAISGRSWDGKRTAWVYPKTVTVFEALAAEFKSDADVFEIRKPKTIRPKDLQPPAGNDDEDEWFIPGINELEESQTAITGELTALQEKVGLLHEAMGAHDKQIRKVLELQEFVKGALEEEKSIESPPSDEASVLDFSHAGDFDRFEEGLVYVAFRSSDRSKSFGQWLERIHPISRPHDFVFQSQEHIMDKLRGLLADADPGLSHYDLIKQAEAEQLIYQDPQQPRYIYSLLHAMRHIRNKVAHSATAHDWDVYNLSITYLMNLAIVWPRVVVDDE